MSKIEKLVRDYRQGHRLSRTIEALNDNYMSFLDITDLRTIDREELIKRSEETLSVVNLLAKISEE